MIDVQNKFKNSKVRLTTKQRINRNQFNDLTLPQPKSGFLHKKSPALFAGWQERYFVLKNRKLKYFKSNKPEDMHVPKGVINFDQFSCAISDMKDKLFSIKISGVENREFELKAKTDEICQAWVSELIRHFNKSEGCIEYKSAEGIKKPWRFDGCSEKQFFEKADTGDILIF